MRYILSIGTNVGNREDNIQNAVAMLEKINVKPVKISSLYETSPVEYYRQADFYNIAIEVDTPLEPEELLNGLKSLEMKMGRETAVMKGPRIIDLDIVCWERGNYFSHRLRIPHKAALDRLFVMVPSLELIEDHPYFSTIATQMKDAVEHKNLSKEQTIIKVKR